MKLLSNAYHSKAISNLLKTYSKTKKEFQFEDTFKTYLKIIQNSFKISLILRKLQNSTIYALKR